MFPKASERTAVQDEAWERNRMPPAGWLLLGTEREAGKDACRHLDQSFNSPFPCVPLMAFLFNEQRLTHVTMWNMKKGESWWRH